MICHVIVTNVGDSVQERIDRERIDVVQENLEKLGIALRDARLKAGLTQGEVGQRARVSRQLVSRIEQGCNGEISAYLSVAAALQLRLGVMDAEDRLVLLGDITPPRLF